MKALLITAAMLFITCSSFAQPANPNAVTSDKDVPFEWTVYNPCCGEGVYVDISGVMHVIFGPGPRQSPQHGNFRNATAIDGYGNQYVQQGTAIINYTYPPNNSVGTGIMTLKFANDNGCGFTVTVIQHVTYNANGELSVRFQNWTITCDNE